MITPNTQARVWELLNNERTADRLVSHLSQAFAAQNDPIAMAQSLLEQFRAGLSDD
jgi:hypothetical protein